MPTEASKAMTTTYMEHVLLLASQEWEKALDKYPREQPRCISCKFFVDVDPPETTFSCNTSRGLRVLHPQGACFLAPQPLSRYGYEFCGEHEAKATP